MHKEKQTCSSFERLCLGARTRIWLQVQQHMALAVIVRQELILLLKVVTICSKILDIRAAALTYWINVQ